MSSRKRDDEVTPSTVGPPIRFLKMVQEHSCACGAQLLVGDRGAYDRVNRQTMCMRCAYQAVEMTASPALHPTHPTR